MTISIRRDGTTGTRHILKIRNHEIPVDASPAGGGSDAGPEVVVDRDDSEERKGVYRLKSGLRVSGDLSEAQRDELLRVAGKCPVHKLMTEVKTEIETGWAD